MKKIADMESCPVADIGKPGPYKCYSCTFHLETTGECICADWEKATLDDAVVRFLEGADKDDYPDFDDPACYCPNCGKFDEFGVDDLCSVCEAISGGVADDE